MEVQKIPLALVFPSPMNPRKTFDEAGLAELADNIEKQGLLQPITVRPVKHPTNEFGDRPDKYEIVCGERRYRACLILQEKWQDINAVAPDNRFDSILAIVREMTDDEAFDAMITENLQRKDVDPLEEAFAFTQLVERGSKVEDIAARFGKSTRFVQERIRLNNLIPEIKAKINDDTLPLSAAMQLSKLDSERQLDFYNIYKEKRVTLDETRHHIGNLFMRLDYALWHTDGREDFEKGCGRTCAVCEFNTANHGCLFHEMKDDSKGNCTNRKKYIEKIVAYCESLLEMEGTLLKEGESLKPGATAITIVENSYDSASLLEMKREMKKMAERHSFLVVDNPNRFGSRVWLDKDENKTVEGMRDGKLFRIIDLFEYSSPRLTERFFKIKEDAAESETKNFYVPTEVRDTITSLRAERTSGDGKNVAGAKAIITAPRFKEAELSAVEKQAFVASTLASNPAILQTVRLDRFCGREKILEFSARPDAFDMVVRELIRYGLKDTPVIHHLGPMLDILGTLWCREEYVASINAARKKHESKVKKLEKKLLELGYDENGMKIKWSEKDVADVPLPATHSNFEEFARMKVKHPGAILLFRNGDRYEAYGEDAVLVANSCKLGLTEEGAETDSYKYTWFLHTELDTKLPALIRTGRKVAICESK